MSYITLKDVTEQAGVSLATASQAIRGVGRISEKTSEHVKQIASQLGYVPVHGQFRCDMHLLKVKQTAKLLAF